MTKSQQDSIRPFTINIPEAQLADLRQRIHATRWPDAETVNDQSQGVQTARIQALEATMYQLGMFFHVAAARKRQSSSRAMCRFYRNRKAVAKVIEEASNDLAAC